MMINVFIFMIINLSFLMIAIEMYQFYNTSKWSETRKMTDLLK